MSKVFIMMGGIPGSGKSTRVAAMTKALEAKGYTVFVVRPDDHLMEGDKYVWTPERSKRAWELAYTQLGAWLKCYEPKCVLSVCIFDATLLDPRSRRQVFSRVKDHKEVRTKCVFMNTPIALCHARNDLRPEDRKVPKATMDAMESRLVLPTKDEGFDSVDIITPDDSEEVVKLEDME